MCRGVQVRFSRDGTDGEFEVDISEFHSLASSGQSRTVEVNAPFYVGGMPADVASNAAHNMQVRSYDLRALS